MARAPAPALAHVCCHFVVWIPTMTASSSIRRNVVMARRNEVLAAMIEELDAVGIKPTIEQGRRCHLKVRWTTPCGRLRTVIVAGTCSGHRARYNARSFVRRTLRQ